MYNGFFNFREKPFKLVPNPEFLFLGKSHEEALAHLTYATSQGDGFVEIIGEIGTGKTTLCRVFLEDLNKDIEAAFIFNSKLDSVQLIKAIHTELSIDCEATDPANLTNSLNQFLLKKKAIGKSVILLIDEAQNLGQETLEQLRLLSNLETTRSKLLQIILVGQPELGEILDSYKMRQLKQRINLTCHILPLTLKETRDYIEHRVNVASRKPQALFTHPAKNDIYKYSRGIPRLINIACDRSLLAAYSLNQKKVTPSIVKLAIRELNTRIVVQTRPNFFINKTTITVFSLIFIAILLATFFNGIPSKWIPWISSISSDNNTETKAEIPEIPPKYLIPVVTVPPPIILKEPLPSKPVIRPILSIEKADVKTILSNVYDTATRENGMAHILSLWGSQFSIQFDPLIKQIESDPYFFRMAARQNNLQLLHIKEGLNLIEKFNLPAILKFALPNHPEKNYLVLVKITPDNEYVIFPGNANKEAQVAPDDLMNFLTGDIYVVWKNIFGYAGTISETSSKASVVSLKLLLRQIGFTSIDLTPVYDDQVKKAVKQIQAKHGLVEDGLVGNMTKIILSYEKSDSSTPSLTESILTDHLKGN